MILELSRLATGPLEHLVEINSLNAHLCECDRRPWFHGSDVRPIFIFAISNSYVLLSLLNTLGKPEKLYCTGFGQANAEIQSFEEH